MNIADSPIVIDCYARAAALGAPVDEPIETLREYDLRGVIEDLTVRVWPDEVVLTDDTQEASPIAQYRRFQTWADQAGVSLRPGFTIRQQGSLVSDQTTAALVLPTVSLAIHVDGELATVVPHQTDTTTYTVEDALADLAAPDQDPPSHPPTTDAAADSPDLLHHGQN
jgi:hypothetical protein